MTREQNGSVLAIYICGYKGEDMSSVRDSRVIAGRGLEGDRYALGRGAFSRSMPYMIRHLSLISRQAIIEANANLETPYGEAETRRNIVTEGVELNDLVDRKFAVGNVTLRGVELCDPCRRPEKLTGKQGFEDAFKNLGGLRAEVLTDGLIAVGSDIRLV